jgi:alpha-glucuronidase
MSKNKVLALVSVMLVLALAGQICARPAMMHDGSGLWFTNYKLSPFAEIECPTSICIQETGTTLKIIENELIESLNKLFGKEVPALKKAKPGSIIIITSKHKSISEYLNPADLQVLGNDGFIIRSNKQKNLTIIAANTEIGELYGTYHYLRLLRTSTASLKDLSVSEKPLYQRRILNHWDNLDGTVERGYAGRSIWKWDELPNEISPRYLEYARANASVGINGTVLNNVNANPRILETGYLGKVKIIADILRPYGIRVYLAVNFSSPAELGGLKNSDPLNPEVQNWWNTKASEIYSLIPDFGGFLVKANSEGLPGPQDYGRSHADGANMLADALKPYGGIVMWRAFVYKPDGDDRAKQAYQEFMPLDGKFRKNVIIQVKNGPVDFQPREPFSPLFGSMEQTSLMGELQITQEYLGFSDHLVYLATLFKEFLDADTYKKGENTRISRITDGSVYGDSTTAIAGVANIGLDANWCGHHFAQANWYSFGRLAWNHQLSSKEIAQEWLVLTFTHDPDFVETLTKVMMESRQAVVDYMMPMGLHHLFAWGHHYGPEPWCDVPGARPDWLPSYYHKAGKFGIGFNRTSSGSNAVEQYAEPLRSMYEDPALCPGEYLLWFHHLPWDYTLQNGRELWDELCYRYSCGVERAKHFQRTWNLMEDKIDPRRFSDVKQKLVKQVDEAIWWRDACVLYFQTFSGREIPFELEKPVHKLDELMKLKFDMKHHN